MGDGLSRNLRQLDDFLTSDAVSYDAMLLSELDGFLAGLIVCPDTIVPSEWMPVVWDEEEPAFDDLEQAQAVHNLILGHYNGIIRQLDQDRYGPIYDVDTRHDDVLWQTWMEGFGKAVDLRPEAWLDWARDPDADLRQALAVMARLRELATIPAQDIEPMDGDQDLRDLAPDLIPGYVQVLHRNRLAKTGHTLPPVSQGRRKVGRNEPCPCGSGKKFKKCCLV